LGVDDVDDAEVKATFDGGILVVVVEELEEQETALLSAGRAARLPLLDTAETLLS